MASGDEIGCVEAIPVESFGALLATKYGRYKKFHDYFIDTKMYYLKQCTFVFRPV